MLANDESLKPPSNTRSYKNLGSGSTSSATAPHARLRGLYKVTERCAETLEKANDNDQGMDLGQIADVMRQWAGTVLRTIHAVEAAEDRRIKDLQGQLDFDREIEEKHQKKLDTSSKVWEVKMRQKEREWQKQAFEARITGQKVAKSSPLNQEHSNGSSDRMPPPNASHAQPRTARSPSPHTRDEVVRLTQEIATLKADHEAALLNTRSSHAGAVNSLKQKAERLADQNTELWRSRKTKEEQHGEEKQKMKYIYEAQIQQLRGKSERLADAKPSIPSHPELVMSPSSSKGKMANGAQVAQSQNGSDKPADADKGLAQDKEQTNRRILHSVLIPRSGSQLSPVNASWTTVVRVGLRG
jgi:hypothetical protein